jgi:regulator of PEP synthase PpsR (kinase-PPPase family)
MQRSAFFVSDGTGITAETLGHSMLAQFGGITWQQNTLPYLQTAEDARSVVAKVNEQGRQDGAKPVVFSTLVSNELRSIIATSDALVLDFFSAFLGPMERELGVRSTHQIGQTHAIRDQKAYHVRIDAVHFALDNDDGARTRHYDQADIILIGLSRSGKTPTSLYLALQFGLRAANYPLTEDDFDDAVLPKCLVEYKSKLFGLTLNAERLSAIRSERKANSRYASMRQVEDEIRGIEAILTRYSIPHLNATDLSIEEISTRILAMTGLKRRLQ